MTVLTNIGQKAKETYTLVTTDGGSIQAAPLPLDCDAEGDCNYITPVLANESGDDLENDKTSILGMFQDWTTSAEFVIQKKIAGNWTDQVTIADDTYGDYYPQGSFASKLKYAGFIVNWASVLSTIGEGLYRIKVTEVNPLYPSGTSQYSMSFCLKEYSCKTAENTVRLDWTNTKKIGDIMNDRRKLDFGDIVWPGQLRIKNSIFGYPKSAYETEEVQYQNGEFQTVSDKQTETYQLVIGPVPSFIHDLIKTNALMSGTLKVSDYSTNNPARIVNKDVKKKSGFEPRWKKTTKCAPVTIELEPRYNNLENDFC